MTQNYLRNFFHANLFKINKITFLMYRNIRFEKILKMHLRKNALVVKKQENQVIRINLIFCIFVTY